MDPHELCERARSDVQRPQIERRRKAGTHHESKRNRYPEEKLPLCPQPGHDAGCILMTAENTSHTYRSAGPLAVALDVAYGARQP